MLLYRLTAANRTTAWSDVVASLSPPEARWDFVGAAAGNGVEDDDSVGTRCAILLAGSTGNWNYRHQDESDSWETSSVDNDLSKKVEPRSNYELIVEDYHAARLQAATTKDRGDKKSQNEAGPMIQKLKEEISALGLSLDLLESGYVSFPRCPSDDIASAPAPSDHADGDMVNLCNIKDDTACTEFRDEVDEKEVISYGSHDNSNDTASLSVPIQNGDALESKSGDVG